MKRIETEPFPLFNLSFEKKCLDAIPSKNLNPRREEAEEQSRDHTATFVAHCFPLPEKRPMQGNRILP